MAGALALQMLAWGRMAEGSSSMSTRTTVGQGRPVKSENN